MHYKRVRKNGNPYIGGRLDEQTRFWRKVQLTQGCWYWQGAVAGKYGRFSLGGRAGGLIQAHRYAYEKLVGPIPDGLTIDHICENKLCVNPAHMEPVTAAENRWPSRPGRTPKSPSELAKGSAI